MIKLKTGDAVAIVAPASHQANNAENQVEFARQQLLAWGLDVRMLCSSDKRYFYLAGDDDYRAGMLRKSLTEPDIKAVFVTRGGYGSLRLLPYLTDLRPSAPRFFCGFSDLTVLLFALSQRFPEIAAVHGPGIASNFFNAKTEQAEQCRNRLYQVLFDQDDALASRIDVINHGRVTAPIVGGCLSVIVSLFGTPYEPDFNGKILFIEDVDEKPYVIDRLLTQLILSGKLAHVRGIVFGDMSQCKDGQHDLWRVVEDRLGSFDIPVVYGLNSGHGAINLAFRFDQMATIDTGKASLNIF